MIMKEHPHGNIVQFHNSYLVGDELWVVMEYVNGGALTAMIQKTRYIHVHIDVHVRTCYFYLCM
jgi:serine/threonine protein kinase